MTSTLLKPQVHEAAAHLLFVNPHDPDDPGLGRYFGVVSQFDRVFDLAEQDERFDAVNESWRVNHNPADDGPSVNYWKGKIKAVSQDYDAFYEYNIPLEAVDETGEKKINFQFRPALPDARHVETGKRIKSMPADLPEGLRVQIQSANIHPDDYLTILRALFRKLGIHTRYIDDVHPWSRLLNLAYYVRLDRSVSEERIVDRNGLLERLARFASTRSGVGEWKWDNEVIIGHRTAVAMNPINLEKFYEGHRIGKLVKSYHMKTPSDDQGSVTFHLKLELQWNKALSPDNAVSWHETDADLDFRDVQDELVIMLYHCLFWADLPLTPDPDIYIEDTYFKLKEAVRDLDLVADPTEALREYERDLATTTLVNADLTEKQTQTLRSITDGGTTQHIDEVAKTAGVSTRTVRRTVSKLSDILHVSRGLVGTEDDVIAHKLADIFYSIDHVLDRAKDSVHKLASQRDIVDENSALAKWARRYAVTVTVDDDVLEIAIELGELTQYQLVKIVRAGFRAAQDIGARTRCRFESAHITYTTTDGTIKSARIHHFGYQPRILGYPLR